MPLTPEVRDLLRIRFKENFSQDPDVLETHAQDASGLHHDPDAVIFAQSPEDVAETLRLATQRGVPVVARGAGTGLAGGCLPARGGIVLSLARMNRILRLDAVDMVAEVEPGVITKTLRDAAFDAGLYYPPDPAGLDKSTLGGNVATNAGGPACLKYGVTRDYALGMTVALPTGQLVRLGALTRKSVAGLDLTRLVAGSEGTLAVITGLTLKLIPRPQAVRALAALFDGPKAAMDYVNAVFAGGLFPCALEFMDGNCLRLVRDILPFDPPSPRATLLLVELDGGEAQTLVEAEQAARIAAQAGALQVIAANGEEERERLWWVRRQISLRIHERCAVYLPEDVVVPLSRIAHLVGHLEELARRFDLDIFAFGHSGDGNIHVNITADNVSAVDRAHACAEALVREVLAQGGTISGEHGVGLVKRPFLPLELSPANIALQHGIKRVFDPAGVLNPGKVLPDPA